MPETRFLSLVLVAASALACPAPAQQQVARLAPPGAPNPDSMGWDVDLDGGWAVAGAPTLGGPGAALVYGRTASGWSFVQTLDGDEPFPAEPQVGWAVGVSGSTVVVGAPMATAAGALAGAVYVFDHDGAAWTRTAKLVPSGAGGWSSFGYDVAVERDTLVVGAPWAAGSAPAAGAVHVFERVATGWELEATLTRADEAGFDQLGWSVAVSGDRIVAGTRAGSGVVGTGLVCVFAREGSGWSLEAELLPDDPIGQDSFGHSVAISGDVVACGAPLANLAPGVTDGAVYVFERDAQGWSERQRLSLQEPGHGDYFGYSVAVDGRFLVTGAHRPGLVTGLGKAYAFRSTGAVWEYEAEFVGELSSTATQFGWSVALDRRTALVGDPLELVDGAAYVFDLDDLLGVYCFGDGSGAPCPCGNEAPADGPQGCANSTGAGARLLPTGSWSVAADDLGFEGRGMPAGRAALLFAGTLELTDGVPFGDGLRCAGGGLVRLETRTTSAEGHARWGPGLGATGGWAPGDTRLFQAWFRDPAGAPCGTGFNLSNGVRLELEE